MRIDADNSCRPGDMDPCCEANKAMQGIADPQKFMDAVKELDDWSCIHDEGCDSRTPGCQTCSCKLTEIKEKLRTARTKISTGEEG